MSKLPYFTRPHDIDEFVENRPDDPTDDEPRFADYEDNIPYDDLEPDGVDRDFLPPDAWADSLSTFVARCIWNLKHLLRKG